MTPLTGCPNLLGPVRACIDRVHQVEGMGCFEISRRVCAKWSIFGLFLVLTGREILLRAQWLATRPYPLDYDGFYYLQELSHRLVSGKGYYHHFSPFFATLEGTARLFSLTPEQTLNVWVMGTLFVLSLSLALIACDRPVWWLAPGFVWLVWQSDVLFYLFYGFLKQSGALAAACLGIVCSERAFPGPSGRSRVPLAFGSACLAVATLYHPYGFLLSALYLLLAHNMRIQYKIIVFVLITALALVGEHSTITKGAELIQSISWSRQPAWFWAWRLEGISPFELGEYVIYLVSGIALAAYAIIQRDGWALVWGCLAVYFVMSLPIWKHEIGGFSYRLLRSSVPLLFLAFALATARHAKTTKAWYLTHYITGILMVALLTGRLLLPAHPHPIGPDMDVQSIAGNSEVLAAWIPKNALVIAPHGIQFRITYFIKRHSSRNLSVARSWSGPVFIVGREPPTDAACVRPSALPTTLPSPSCLCLGGGWYIWDYAGRPGSLCEIS